MAGIVTRKTSRFPPNLPVQGYRTFTVAAPAATHWRKATCAEVGCGHYLNGWAVRVETLTPDLLRTAKTSGRRYRLQQVAEGESYLVFEAGQPCFKASEHRIRLDRPPRYLQRDGDWRGNPTGFRREHTGPGNWLDAFATHQDKLVTRLERG